MRVFFYLAFACGALAQQFEVKGTVVELPSNYPVAGAEVSLAGPKPLITTTDASGTFHFYPDTPGFLQPQVKKEGYSQTYERSPGGGLTVRMIPFLTKDHPFYEVNLYLARLGGLTGRVVDDDTGNPITNLNLSVVRVSYRSGKRARSNATDVTTDQDGRFVAPALESGDHVVTVRPRVTGAARLISSPTKDDVDAVDQDYQGAYWPGGPELDAATPVALVPGSTLDLGTWKLRKVPSYRLHVTISSPDCKEGDQVVLLQRSLDSLLYFDDTISELPCDKDFLLTHYQPGNYSLEFDVVGNEQRNRSVALLPIEVRDRNVDLTVTPQRGMPLEGRVIVAEGAGKPPADIQVRVQPLSGTLDDDVENVTPDAQGRFRFANMHFDRKQVSMSGLERILITGGAVQRLNSWYIREIRYGGKAIIADVFEWNGAGLLEIMVDDRLPAIVGTVMDGDKPAIRPAVILVRWPVYEQDIFRSVVWDTSGDDKGRFRINTPVPPGEYRVVAVPQDGLDKMQQPHVLERLLQRAEKATFEKGGAYDLSLKLTDPSR